MMRVLSVLASARKVHATAAVASWGMGLERESRNRHDLGSDKAKNGAKCGNEHANRIFVSKPLRFECFPVMDELHVSLEHPAKEKSQLVMRQYLPAILVLSVNTLLLYFYYNSFAPVLSLMAKDYGFSNAQRDYMIGTAGPFH